MIEAIAQRSRPRGEPVVDVYVEALLARLRALFSSTELVFASSSRQASILEIARGALAPFISAERPGAIAFSGPSIAVSEQTAAGLALAFHELATNALKHGALKKPDGRVALSCLAEPDGQVLRVAIEWKETGGDNLREAPTRKGFGSRVIESAVSSERENSVDMIFEPDGLRCIFAFKTRCLDNSP